jgi:hypothetical protein
MYSLSFPYPRWRTDSATHGEGKREEWRGRACSPEEEEPGHRRAEEDEDWQGRARPVNEEDRRWGAAEMSSTTEEEAPGHRRMEEEEDMREEVVGMSSTGGGGGAEPLACRGGGRRRAGGRSGSVTPHPHRGSCWKVPATAGAEGWAPTCIRACVARTCPGSAGES